MSEARIAFQDTCFNPSRDDQELSSKDRHIVVGQFQSLQG